MYSIGSRWGLGLFGLYRRRANEVHRFFFTAVPMETRSTEFPGVLGILLLFACVSSRTEAAFDPESFQQKLIALQKTLDYMNDRPEQMNLDATFGATLTEANLVAALLHENAQYLEDKFFIALKKMVALSDLTRKNLMKAIIIPKNESIFLSRFVVTLNNPNLWIKPISWKILPRSRFSPNQLSSDREVLQLMERGTPRETESDQCIINTVHSSLKGECKIPAVPCVATLMKEDDAAGYPLTHRLLIVQVAEAMGCEQVKTTSFLRLVPAYCTRIFQDLVNIEASGFPNIARDLVIEQILLCGMEGYYDFVNKHYEDKILSWPHWSGCYGSFPHHGRFSSEHKITRHRRSTSLTDFGCENHMTSLAAASLAVFIRENIENGLSQL